MKYAVTTESIETSYRSEDAARTAIMNTGMDDIVRTALEGAQDRYPKTVGTYEDTQDAVEAMTALKLSACIAGTNTGVVLEVEVAEVVELDDDGEPTGDVYESRHGDLDELLLNRDELVEELVDKMIDADVSAARPGYRIDTDVDLVYDADRHTGTLETNDHVGNRWWRVGEERDVETIWSKPGLGAIDLYDWYDDGTIADLAEATGVSETDLVKLVTDSVPFIEPEDVAVHNIVSCIIDSEPALLDRLLDAYSEGLRDNYLEDYFEASENAIAEWERGRE